MKQNKVRDPNTEEIWAEEYLRYLGFEDIEFEPRGNRTPDFLVGGRIAIEVRRLNQYYETETEGLKGVESEGVPFINSLQALLRCFGAPRHRVCWYVSCTFERPLPELKKWKKVLQEKLQQVDDACPGYEVIHVDDHLSFSLTRSENHKATERFLMGGYLDHDTGGFVISELERSLKLCTAEKATKIAPYRAEYPEWWVVLVDFMMVGRQKPVRVFHPFDKLIVIHPSDYARAYEIQTLV